VFLFEIKLQLITLYFMDIIISIKPIYTEKILIWEKLFELRKRFSIKKIKKAIIYESTPKSRVVGEFEVEKILYEPLDRLRNNTKDYSCIDKKFFDKYFEWKEKWYAIKIKNPKRYKETKKISDYGMKYPPQSYAFLKN